MLQIVHNKLFGNEIHVTIKSTIQPRSNMASYEQELEKLQQEFTIEKLRYEQKLHESKKEIFSLEIRNNDLNDKVENIQNLLVTVGKVDLISNKNKRIK